MRCDPRRYRRTQRRTSRLDRIARPEAVRARRIQLGERRVVIRRNVGAAPGGEERARPRVRIRRPCCGDGALDTPLLRYIALRMEDQHHRRCFAVSERMQDLLVRLVPGKAGDRKLLEPALRHLLRPVHPEGGEHDPGADDVPPAPMNEMRELTQHRSACISDAQPSASEDRYAASASSCRSSAATACGTTRRVRTVRNNDRVRGRYGAGSEWRFDRWS